MSIRCLLIVVVALSIQAQPVAGEMLYDWDECRGSSRPYADDVEVVAYPDTLTPVMINHVGRHGARYESSAAHAVKLREALQSASSQGTLTEVGEELLSLVDSVIAIGSGSWGRLDWLGMDEQRGIARRMAQTYPSLLKGGVSAVSSYVPRCVMSMYSFCHELTLADKKVEISACSGPHYSSLLRFFDKNEVYKSTVRSNEYQMAIRRFEQEVVEMGGLRRAVGEDYRFGPDSIDVAMAEYSFLAGLRAMGVECELDRFLTLSEFNRLWEAFNFKQYLDRTATNLSSVPADIAEPLLEDLVATTDRFISGDSTVKTINLRFGHAETLMPLLSLMRLPGCYYLTDDYTDVACHWRDFDVVPMAANLQMILFRSDGGRYYVRFDVNEKPLSLPGQPLYLLWDRAKLLL